MPSSIQSTQACPLNHYDPAAPTSLVVIFILHLLVYTIGCSRSIYGGEDPITGALHLRALDTSIIIHYSLRGHGISQTEELEEKHRVEFGEGYFYHLYCSVSEGTSRE